DPRPIWGALRDRGHVRRTDPPVLEHGAAGWLSRPAVDALPGAARDCAFRGAARRGAGAERLDRPLRAGAAQPARDLSGIRRALRRRRAWRAFRRPDAMGCAYLLLEPLGLPAALCLRRALAAQPGVDG